MRLRQAVGGFAFLLGAAFIPSISYARDCPGVLNVPEVRAFGEEQDRIAKQVIPALNRDAHYALDYFRRQVATLGGFNGDKSLQARIRGEPLSSFLACFPRLRSAIASLRQADQAQAEAEDRTRQESLARARQEAKVAEERRRKLEVQRRADAERAIAEQRAADAEKALREQQSAEAQEEGERLEKEARKREAGRQQAEMMPVNVLVRAYSYYIYVKHCHDKREGYSVKYINDQELDRARDEIKGLSTKIKGADDGIDDAAAWRKADDLATRTTEERENCQYTLGLLDSAFRTADPEGTSTKKDFE